MYQQIKKKARLNELYVEKLIKIVHFLAHNNLSVKELYLKMIQSFLVMKSMSLKVNNILKGFLKNAVYDSSDSCDSIIVSLNSHLKKVHIGYC